jgi:hypothetical protein
MAVSLLFTGFTRHPKILRAGEPAAWMFVCLLEHCAEHGTNGLVADYVIDGLPLKNVKGRLAHLLASDERHGPLLVRVDGGYEIHDYLNWNKPAAALAEQVRAKSEARAKAGRKGADSRWGGGRLDGKGDGKGDGKPIANGMATGWQSDSSSPSPSSSSSLVSPASAVKEPREAEDEDLSDLQKQTIAQLATDIHSMRPGIDTPQLEAQMTRCAKAGKSWPRIAIAMIACALDPETKFASRIHLPDGYWWRDSDSRTQAALKRWVKAGHRNPAAQLGVAG